MRGPSRARACVPSIHGGPDGAGVGPGVHGAGHRRCRGSSWPERSPRTGTPDDRRRYGAGAVPRGAGEEVRCRSCVSGERAPWGRRPFDTSPAWPGWGRSWSPIATWSGPVPWPTRPAPPPEPRSGCGGSRSTCWTATGCGDCWSRPTSCSTVPGPSSGSGSRRCGPPSTRGRPTSTSATTPNRPGPCSSSTTPRRRRGSAPSSAWAPAPGCPTCWPAVPRRDSTRWRTATRPGRSTSPHRASPAPLVTRARSTGDPPRRRSTSWRRSPGASPSSTGERSWRARPSTPCTSTIPAGERVSATRSATPSR